MGIRWGEGAQVARVQAVTAGGYAARLGVAAGDVLVKADNLLVKAGIKPAEFQSLIMSLNRPSTLRFNTIERFSAPAGYSDIVFAQGGKMGINWDRSNITRVDAVPADGYAVRLGVAAGFCLVNVNAQPGGWEGGRLGEVVSANITTPDFQKLIMGLKRPCTLRFKTTERGQKAPVQADIAYTPVKAVASPMPSTASTPTPVNENNDENGPPAFGWDKSPSMNPSTPASTSVKESASAPILSTPGPPAFEWEADNTTAQAFSPPPSLPAQLSEEAHKFQVWLWLERAHLEEHYYAFIEYGIDQLEHIRDVEEDDIQSMGITRPIHVKKLKREVASIELKLFMTTPDECQAQCPLTRQAMTEPVVAADGHTYERAAIAKWMASHTLSPMTRQPLAHQNLAPR
jgi:hypothetical protein